MLTGEAMRTLPVMLNLAGRVVLVVGGGPVATRKVSRLLETGCEVRVVALEAHAAMHELAREEAHVSLEERAFRDVDLDGVDLAFSATGRPEVEDAVLAAARSRGVWINAADDPDRCTFHMPATCERGPLQVAVSTGGASPALAARVRDEVDSILGPEYAAAVELLGRLRSEIEGGPERSRAFADLLDGGLLEALRRGDATRVERLTAHLRRGLARSAAGGGDR